MVYRTNAYVEREEYQLTRLDRLSYKLVGHYCLFTNISTAFIIMIPLWLGIFLVGLAMYYLW